MIIKRNKLGLVCLFAMLLTTSVIGQSSIGGNLSIDESGKVYVYGTHSFLNGSGFIVGGKIETARKGNKGYLIFAKNSAWKDASEQGYVDGYVQTLSDQSFVFPVGEQGVFRPVGIASGYGTTAAYYNSNPNQKIDKRAGFGAVKVSTKEFWDIKGQESTSITLSWGKESETSYLTDGQLENLTIVGYKNGKWYSIPSRVEQNLPEWLSAQSNSKNGSSDFSYGAITTLEPIIPSDYEYITLGAALPKIVASPTNAISIFPNPVVHDIYVDLTTINAEKGKILIVNSYGQQVAERIFDSRSNTIQHFNVKDYAAGMYDLQIKIEDDQLSKKFVVKNL